MGIMENTTGIATGTLKPGYIITGAVKATAIVMFHMRSHMLFRGWSLEHITGLRVLRL